MDASVYGLLAEFDSPEALEAAAKAARTRGYSRMEAFTPFPIEGMDDVVGHRPSKLAALVFCGGFTGGTLGFLFETWSQGISYPFMVAGRPFFSWPAFIPVTFECTILGAALTAVFGMFILNGLPQPYHPLFNADRFSRVTTDGFFLCIEATDPKFDLKQTEKDLSGWHAKGVTAVEP